jgi:hypothetical protein
MQPSAARGETSGPRPLRQPASWSSAVMLSNLDAEAQRPAPTQSPATLAIPRATNCATNARGRAIAVRPTHERGDRRGALLLTDRQPGCRLPKSGPCCVRSRGALCANRSGDLANRESRRLFPPRAGQAVRRGTLAIPPSAQSVNSTRLRVAARGRSKGVPAASSGEARCLRSRATSGSQLGFRRCSDFGSCGRSPAFSFAAAPARVAY